MSHADMDRLTEWVHGLLEPEEARAVQDHVGGCAECAEVVEHLREEADVLAREVASPRRLASLKGEILRQARSLPVAAAASPRSGFLWQLGFAAALLVAFVILLLAPPASRHALVEGKVVLADGSELSAPAVLPANRAWELRAVEKATLRLADGSAMEIGERGKVGLRPEGPRGVTPELVAGRVRMRVAGGGSELEVCSPSGRARARDAEFKLEIVSTNQEGGVEMKGIVAGVVVTALVGSVYLSNPYGAAEASVGETAVLPMTEAPVFVAQEDDVDAALQRLEKLAAAIARLEEEIKRLEERNKQLTAQLQSSKRGWGIRGGHGGSGMMAEPKRGHNNRKK